MNRARPDTAADREARFPSDTENPTPQRRFLLFDELDGWDSDDHAAALAAFRVTGDLAAGPAWAALDRIARAQPDPRRFFESQFRPVLVGQPPALFTGYYEPELDGALAPTERFRTPIYAAPPGLPTDRPWATRTEIEENDLLAGRGLEIAWLADPVEAFFLQVQGSGRIRLPDGRSLRIGYAARNGHPYRSIGQEMIRRGLLGADTITAAGIKAWLRAHPADCAGLLRHNPSFVFFRRLPDGADPEEGPPGAMGRPVTAGRSIAVDPAFIPLGAPVWIETEGPAPLRRLMIAQDTGSAIKGAQRADIFFGTGDAAGEAAGALRQPGRMVVLEPIGQEA